MVEKYFFLGEFVENVTINRLVSFNDQMSLIEILPVWSLKLFCPP